MHCCTVVSSLNTALIVCLSEVVIDSLHVLLFDFHPLFSHVSSLLPLLNCLDTVTVNELFHGLEVHIFKFGSKVFLIDLIFVDADQSIANPSLFISLLVSKDLSITAQITLYLKEGDLGLFSLDRAKVVDIVYLLGDIRDDALKEDIEDDEDVLDHDDVQNHILKCEEVWVLGQQPLHDSALLIELRVVFGW